MYVCFYVCMYEQDRTIMYVCIYSTYDAYIYANVYNIVIVY